MNEAFLLVIIFIALLIWLFVIKPKAEESRIEWERQRAKARVEQEKKDEEARIKRERQRAKARAEQERQEEEARIKRERQRAKARAEQERQEEEARIKRERLKRAVEEREKKITKQNDQLLRKIRSTAPDFILKAKLEFEREFKSQTDQSFFGQDMSPLTCFGYRVGKTNGRPENERQAILRYAIVADLDISLPFLPIEYRQEWGSPLSETRVSRICNHLKAMADLRSTRSNFEFAIAQWRKDAVWVQAEYRSIMDQFKSV
jgi:flagellar biosynthesis GTPase FlhF